jgi:hypothetical protein
MTTASALKQGVDWFARKFYRTKRIAKRTVTNLINGNIYSALLLSLPVNIAYASFAQKYHIHGKLPAYREPVDVSHLP